MKKTETKKLIIELPSDYPEILKDDIQQVLKHTLILFQLLSKKFPPTAIKDIERVLNQVLTSLDTPEEPFTKQ